MKRYASLAAVIALTAASLSARAEVRIVGEIIPNGDGTFASVVLASDEAYEPGKTVTFFVNGAAIANAVPPANAVASAVQPLGLPADYSVADLPYYSTLWTPPAVQGQMTVNEVVATPAGARKISEGITIVLDQQQGIPVPLVSMTEYGDSVKRPLSTRNPAKVTPIGLKLDAALAPADWLNPETSLSLAVPTASLTNAVIGVVANLGALVKANTGAASFAAGGTAIAVNRASVGSKTAGWINTNTLSFFKSTAIRETNVIQNVRVPRILATSTRLAVAPPKIRPAVGFFVYSYGAAESLSTFGGTAFVSSKPYRFVGGDFEGPRVKVNLANNEFVTGTDTVEVKAEDPAGVLRIEFRIENTPLGTVTDPDTTLVYNFQSRNWSTATRGGKGKFLASAFTGTTVGVDRTVVVAFRALDIYGNPGPVVLRTLYVQ